VQAPGERSGEIRGSPDGRYRSMLIAVDSLIVVGTIVLLWIFVFASRWRRWRELLLRRIGVNHP
jgi:hypothetical protein